jgi:proteasome lid subunit RPN8/RPN11
MLFKYFKDKWKEWQAEKERRRKEAEEATAHTIWRIYYESKTIDHVSRMSGIQFEEFLACLFSRMGYTEITLTPPNDQGGDLLCLSPSGVPIVIQAKRWKGNVGNDAVQELLGAMRHYVRTRGMVVTNSTFTQSARQLAGTGSDITLCDKRWLEEQVKKFFPPGIPEFNQEEFNRIIKELAELTRASSTDCVMAGQLRKRARGDFTFTGMLMRAGAAKGRELTSKEIIDIAMSHVKIADLQTKLDATAKDLKNIGKAPAGPQPDAADKRKPAEAEWTWQQEHQPSNTQQEGKDPQRRPGADAAVERAARGVRSAKELAGARERRFGEPLSESERLRGVFGGGSAEGETSLPKRLTAPPNALMGQEPYRLLLPQKIYHDMISHAQTDSPNMCCGLLAGKVERGAGQVTKLYRLVNDAASPKEYLAELHSMFRAVRDMRRSSLDVLAVYSSRPISQPVPRRMDLERNYSPAVMSLIISLKETEPQVRAWWLAANEYWEASWEVCC